MTRGGLPSCREGERARSESRLGAASSFHSVACSACVQAMIQPLAHELRVVLADVVEVGPFVESGHVVAAGKPNNGDVSVATGLTGSTPGIGAVLDRHPRVGLAVEANTGQKTSANTGSGSKSMSAQAPETGSTCEHGSTGTKPDVRFHPPGPASSHDPDRRPGTPRARPSGWQARPGPHGRSRAASAACRSRSASALPD